MKNIVQAAWAEYSQKMISANAGDDQMNQTKLAFYAGGTAMFMMMVNHVACLPDKEGKLLMERISNELNFFGSKYKAKGRVP